MSASTFVAALDAGNAISGLRGLFAIRYGFLVAERHYARAVIRGSVPLGCSFR
jgi:hypothetical protein